ADRQNMRLSSPGGLRRCDCGKLFGIARELSHVRGGTEEVGAPLVRVSRRIRLVHGFSVYWIGCVAVNRRVPLKVRETASTAEVVLLSAVNICKAGFCLNRVLQHADPTAIVDRTLPSLRIACVMYQGWHCQTGQNNRHH